MAGFGTAIEATVGANVDPLRKAGPEIDGVAGSIAGSMAKKFEMKDVGRTMAAVLGFNLQSMSENVARFFTRMTKEVEDKLADMARLTTETAAIYDRIFEARRGNSQSAIAAEERNVSLLKQQAAIYAEIEAKLMPISKSTLKMEIDLVNQQRAIQSRNLLEGKSVELKTIEQELAKNAQIIEAARIREVQRRGAAEQNVFEKTLANQTVAQQINTLTERKAALEQEINTFKGAGVDLDVKKQQLEQTSNALLDARNKQRAESDRRALEIDQQSFEYEKAHHEQLLLEAKLKTGTILPAERERLNVIRLQVKEAGIQKEMAMLLEKPLKAWTQRDKERFAVLQQQTKEIEKQIGLITNPPIPANPPIIEEIKSYVDAWDKFVVKVSSSGKGDTQLSDRELARKKDNIEQELFISGINRINRIGVGNEGGFDPFGTINESNLANVRAEQQLRATNRRNAAVFGDDRAFAMSGLSEQRWADIMRESQDKSESTQILRDIEQGQQRGFDNLAQALKDRPRG